MLRDELGIVSAIILELRGSVPLIQV